MRKPTNITVRIVSVWSLTIAEQNLDRLFPTVKCPLFVVWVYFQTDEQDWMAN